jgi:hypothetical protein
MLCSHTHTHARARDYNASTNIDYTNEVCRLRPSMRDLPTIPSGLWSRDARQTTRIVIQYSYCKTSLVCVVGMQREPAVNCAWIIFEGASLSHSSTGRDVIIRNLLDRLPFAKPRMSWNLQGIPTHRPHSTPQKYYFPASGTHFC